MNLFYLFKDVSYEDKFTLIEADSGLLKTLENIFIGDKGYVINGNFYCKDKIIDLNFIKSITLGGNKMTRRVGSYINPISNEEDWIEPHMVKKIVLQSDFIKTTDNLASKTVNYVLDNDEKNKTITIESYVLIDNEKISSGKLNIDELVFADAIKDIIYNSRGFQNDKFIKDMKLQSYKMLLRQMRRKNIALHNDMFSGIGFITSNNKRYLSIESVKSEYIKENEVSNYRLNLEYCVGLASLRNLKEATIEFIDEDKKIIFTDLTVEESTEASLKFYTVLAKNMTIENYEEEPIEIKNYDFNSLSNEVILNDFMKNRMSLLHSEDNDKEEEIVSFLTDFM